MDEQSARAALATVGLSPRHVELVADQGWASWTFELDGELIVRFPRTDAIVDAMHREMRLLPALGAQVSFSVPTPVVAAEDWYVYEKIPGRGFERGDDVASALAVIDELHTFPVDEARRLLGCASWDERWAATLALFEAWAFPQLPADLLEQVLEAWAFDPPERETLVHDDLGLEHLIVDAATRRVIGVIDFEDASVGDPEVDLVPISYELGLPTTERMWRFRWNGSLHAIVHHVWEDEPAGVAAAVEELRRRLSAEPRR